jgi:hypothetical protein
MQLSGEAVIVGADGLTDFFALHKALASRSAPICRRMREACSRRPLAIKATRQ